MADNDIAAQICRVHDLLVQKGSDDCEVFMLY